VAHEAELKAVALERQNQWQLYRLNSADKVKALSRALQFVSTSVSQPQHGSAMAQHRSSAVALGGEQLVGRAAMPPGSG
jgi:hypothetical protein